MRSKQQMTGFSVLLVGLGINLLDGYFSGNLPFSPDQSDQNNKLSLLNRLGKDSGAPGMTLGTMLALVGGLILLTSWVVGRKN